MGRHLTPRPRPPEVALVTVGEPVLAALVAAAASDADADEVTPRLGLGDAWTADRRAWLTAYHRDRREGLAGPPWELTRAVVFGGDARAEDGSAGEGVTGEIVAGEVVGGVRLARTAVAGVLETGIWLTRAVRGRGVGRSALLATLALAADFGAQRVRAVTTAGNSASRAMLAATGFHLTLEGDAVTGVVELSHPDGGR